MDIVASKSQIAAHAEYARVNGLGIDANPYPEGTHAYVEWLAQYVGHDEGIKPVAFMDTDA